MQSDIIILDGAWGARLRAEGMPPEACPEHWIWQRPELTSEIAESYWRAGAQTLLTPTFGANAAKLEAWGLERHYKEINHDLAKRMRDQLPQSVLLGGCMGPSGPVHGRKAPFDFEGAVRNYATQAQALLEGGVGSFHLEAMTDLNEARAAMIGIRQISDLPVFVTMAFENGQTLAGDRPACCTIVLEALGAAAVGVNCGRSPEELLQVVEDMSAYARKPVIAKPGAGTAEAPLDPGEFARQSVGLAVAGARNIGGGSSCTPEHLRRLTEKVRGLRFMPVPGERGWMLSSRRRCLPFANALVIGNLRVVSNARFLQRIKRGEYAAVRGEIDIMGEAQMLCIHAVAEGLDEVSALYGIAKEAWQHTDLPMAFRPQRPSALEAVLREYPGKALVILDCVQEKERVKVQEIAGRYGALCML